MILMLVAIMLAAATIAILTVIRTILTMMKIISDEDSVLLRKMVMITMTTMMIYA